MSLETTTPQSSKRKYTSYREPSNPMPPRTETSGRVVVPTVETQELYNRWRRADEGLNEESLRQVQDMHAGHLQPPSPSRATSSRSPSNASTTYSVSHAMGEMDVGDQRSQTGKQKPGRRGPLNPIKQLRANLMRKIGACADCRERRVSCKNHHILTLFEQAYEAAKQKTNLPVNTAHHTEPTTPYQTRLGNPADLAGVGGGQNPIGDLPYQLPDSPQAVMDDNFLDFDLSPNTQLSSRPHLAPILSIFPGAQVPVSNPTAQYPLVPGPQSSQRVLIGKQFAPMSQHWVCFGESYASGFSLSDGRPKPCSLHLPDLLSLEQHFATYHARCDGQYYYTWGCINCHYQVSELHPTNPFCIQCQKPSEWEMWYWGTVDHPSALPSAVPGLSISQGESPSGPSSQTSHSAQHPGPSTTYSNAYMPSSGGYGYGYGGGQSYMCTPTPTTSDTKLTCHACKPLIADMCLSKLSHLKTGEKAVFLRRVCPAAIVLAVFVFAFIARVLSPASNHNHFADGVDPIMWNLLIWPLMRNGRPSIPQLSIACIIAGLTGTWLFCHVMDKMMQPSAVQQYERYHMHAVTDVSVSAFGKAKSGPVTIDVS